jgi:ankyrin repeat protein
MAAYLLSKGLDPNDTNDEWGSPLHCAVRAEKANIIQLLLDAGAHAMVRSTGRKTLGETPAEIAGRVSHQGARETLLSVLQLDGYSEDSKETCTESTG